MAGMDISDTDGAAARPDDGDRPPDQSTGIDRLQADLESADAAAAPDLADELASRLADQLDADEERS